MPTDLFIVKAAKRRAHEYARAKTADQIGDADQAAIDGYQQDALNDPILGIRRDLWDSKQETLYRLAFVWQLIALGL
ncbi:MAG: hypothetical protein ABI977_03900 [Acidobacteriota bacterium]